jgi:hypothetical protein
MSKTNEHRISNFWVGFSLGIAGTVALAYLFGTKTGRSMVKKTLRFSEDLEENLEHFIEEVDNRGPKKKNRKSGLSFDNIENVLTKIRQVTNHS